MGFTTADIANERTDEVASIPGILLDLGGRIAFEGRVRTLRSPGDHGLARRLLGEPGDGAVLVIDGDGRTDSALVGDDMVALGTDHGWTGIILNGVVRDRDAMAGRPFGVKALGSNPKSSPRAGSGEIDVPVTIGGVTFHPGRHVWADRDGIVVEV